VTKIWKRELKTVDILHPSAWTMDCGLRKALLLVATVKYARHLTFITTNETFTGGSELARLCVRVLQQGGWPTSSVHPPGVLPGHHHPDS
jgi:hypothetical protein